jgi:hypothetical protein
VVQRFQECDDDGERARVRPAAAELEPVSPLPVGRPAVRGRDMRARGFGNPPGWQEPLALPYAAVQVQEAKPGDRARGDVQTAEAHLAARRIPHPADLADAQRIEQAGPRVLAQRLARELLAMCRTRMDRLRGSVISASNSGYPAPPRERRGNLRHGGHRRPRRPGCWPATAGCSWHNSPGTCP